MPEGAGSAPGQNGRRKIHPGSGRRKAPLGPKGRHVEPQAHDEIAALLGDAPRRRDLLIEHLHRIQDRYGHLSARHLAALAEEMRLPMAAVYETASFYAHFDIVDDGETPPPALTVRVCDSLTCEMLGAKALLEALPGLLGPEVRVVRAPCMGRCDLAPSCEVGHGHVDHATPAAVQEAVATGRTHAVEPDYRGLEAYRAEGGYALLEACLAGEHSPEHVIGLLSDSGLRGLGGAGFPAGRKWAIVREEAGPRYLTVNADEGEPGTFKDRHYLERDPHRFLEGLLIAAWAVGCERAWIYLRDEYPAIRTLLTRELALVAGAGLTAHCPIELRRGAGAYICGEESAMLESLEGKRGYPRHKPPYIASVGLFGRPTLNHNVETLFWVRDIVERGPAWFSGQGRHGSKGFRSFSVSGRVREPGVKLAPAGITVRELIDEFCGGMAEGHTLKGYLPGGASGGILPASMADHPLDFGLLEKHGALIGSAAVIVLSQADDIRAATLNLMRFFEDESCGQCTPCRNGTEKAVQLLSSGRWDRPLLEELSRVMADASICGLGQAAPNPILTALRFFPDEVASDK
ncbi:NAD-dependent formate dehydrogenase flavoprotein subunit [Tistlia consotensis]|uniref:NAD-dependent formate dehydrogenase flavoprotein subunit n=1 Tax=Tistlia consotensis USBA 355 TaxID=560819 RepID=A0A1Y6CLS7_9PROT|nr:NADH-ubiquinone oxidoreductase-F iron-sulfur binding region domain-containing protein [Tistlia consotensis]SMF76234.1 NAD-dependent formate dehydrogenase flavoprotein subunit [Tistlia consotensis USBA 355]SNS12545.1 NAD-dependent formate dehydrogenase flavoprotein subunit [Tistlia consotensis]